MNNKCYSKDITEISKRILQGKLKRFPSGPWNEDPQNENAQKTTRYLIEEI
ncbi:hypothetical protein IGI01_20760 [Bacillus thuringiensis]|nr:hypothetical protein [Bacillus thuringiensis]